jgi:hypothetical protein
MKNHLLPLLVVLSLASVATGAIIYTGDSVTFPANATVTLDDTGGALLWGTAGIYRSASGRLDVTDGGVDTADGLLGASAIILDDGTDDISLNASTSTLEIRRSNQSSTATLDCHQIQPGSTGHFQQLASSTIVHKDMGWGVTLTDGVATLVGAPNLSGFGDGGNTWRVYYAVTATTADEQQVVTGTLELSSTVDDGSDYVPSSLIDIAGPSAASSGTLTVEWSTDNWPASTYEITELFCNANSSLSTPTIKVTFGISSTGTVSSGGAGGWNYSQSDLGSGTAGNVTVINPLGHLGHGTPYGQTRASESLTGMSGATVATTSLVPAGARLLSAVIEVDTTITGCTTINIGDGTDAVRFGTGIALTAGTTTTHVDFTDDPTGWSSGTQDITITAVGGAASFSAGAVTVTAAYEVWAD